MHVYALLKTPTFPLNLPKGVVSALELVVCEQLAAVVERELGLEELQENDATLLQAVLAHDRVIRELFGQTTVLPLRFTTFPALEELTNDLQTRQANYLETITQLEGKAEYTIKLSPIARETTPIPSDLKGKDYFLAKKQQHQEQQHQQALQSQELAQIYQAIAQRYSTQTNPDLQQIHILTDRSNSPQLQQEVAILQNCFKSWEILLSEALPPFHFV
ncbi:MAG: GvpL/GvpF family gas vesicle protein [Oscillatoriales cyanobacterium C42_A2020_001]|nr:GvpL/GvpF family gas vesicle protein [Leptolyngbyaceae cyanobacterium C42_A2020_001]